jgi:hypothetical protein
MGGFHTPIDVERAVALHAAGKSNLAISREIGCSVSGLSKHFRRLNLSANGNAQLFDRDEVRRLHALKMGRPPKRTLGTNSISASAADEALRAPLRCTCAFCGHTEEGRARDVLRDFPRHACPARVAA